MMQGGDPACWSGPYNYENCCILATFSCWDAVYTEGRASNLFIGVVGNTTASLLLQLISLTVVLSLVVLLPLYAIVAVLLLSLLLFRCCFIVAYVVVVVVVVANAVAVVSWLFTYPHVLPTTLTAFQKSIFREATTTTFKRSNNSSNSSNQQQRG